MEELETLPPMIEQEERGLEVGPDLISWDLNSPRSMGVAGPGAEGGGVSPWGRPTLTHWSNNPKGEEASGEQELSTVAFNFRKGNYAERRRLVKQK